MFAKTCNADLLCRLRLYIPLFSSFDKGEDVNIVIDDELLNEIFLTLEISSYVCKSQVQLVFSSLCFVLALLLGREVEWRGFNLGDF